MSSNSQPQPSPLPIAIVGLSGRYPGGATSPERLWQLLVEGTDAIGVVQGDRWDTGWHHPDASRPTRVYTNAGGFLDTKSVTSFDAEFFGLSPREAAQVDPQQRLLLELAWEAHEDAGIAPRSRAGSDTGVFVGICSNDYASLFGWRPNAYTNTGNAASIAANRISYFFDFHGPSFSVDTACSSSLVAVHQACVSLQRGECSAALAGGVSILNNIGPWLGFAKASMLSPDGRCKSFDAEGNGFVRSEGGGFVLLKRLADAERDGDRILGVIAASGVNSDGRTMGISLPNGEAQEVLLRKVYAESQVAAEDVFYVEAHGPGTAVGDPIECGALGRVLGMPRTDGSVCHIGSVKSNIGHLEGASGIAGLTKLLLCLKHRAIPGNLHFNIPNPKIEFENWKLSVVTRQTPLPARPVTMGINSFGFGGTNAHLVIREYAPQPVAAAPESATATTTPQVLILSGHSEPAVRDLARAYAESLRRQSADSWEAICAATATTRSPLRYRLALSASSKEEAAGRLEQYLAGVSCAHLATGDSPARAVPVAFVYSGNGPQWWGMGRELLAANATFRAELEAVDAIFQPLAGWSLLEEMGRPEEDNRIALTEVAQPLLFALQLGLTKVLGQAGIEPAAVLGHSVGEVAAAHISGALDREQATRVIYYRSQEQGKTAGLGRMAALGCSPEEAQAAIAQIGGWLELAATNAPQAVTVAGDPAALEVLVQQMTAAGKFARVLPLNYPFHTKAMDSIRLGLVDALATLTPAAAAISFFSTVEGKQINGEELGAEYWYRNVREPVRFGEAVTGVLSQGIALFLEVGPHPVLKDYVMQTAKSAQGSALALPTLRRPGAKGPEPESANLQSAICTALAHGACDPAQLYAKPVKLPALPLYPWQRVYHWRGGVALPGTDLATRRDHPLLGHRVPTQDGLWENTLDTHRLAYLEDHVVQSSVLFPAAGYVEIALAAAQRTLDASRMDIENFEILRPLAIAPSSEPGIQIGVDAHDGTFEIRSRADASAADWTTHVRGRLSRVEGQAPGQFINLAELSARMPCAVSGQQHYAGAAARGLAYGPQFQGVTNVLLTAPNASQREALAEVALPKLDQEALAGHLAHPAILDSCIQVLITLIGQNERRNCSTIPVQIERVRSLAPLTNRLFCHVVMRRESSRSAVADFFLRDVDGQPLMIITGARCQKVDFAQAAATPFQSEWWRPDPAGVVLAPPPALPEPQAVLSAFTLPPAGDSPEFHPLLAAYASSALAAIHPGGGSFDLGRLARKGAVKRDQMALLSKLIQIAEADGKLIAEKGGWRWAGDCRVENPADLWRPLFEAHPRHQAELLALAQAGESLAARLRGEPAPDLQSLVDQLHDTAPWADRANQAARAALEQLAAQWPKTRPMRILEAGGAGGGLTAWLLPTLDPRQTDYVFSDPSEAAVARAEHRFAAHRFVRFATLDWAGDAPSTDLPCGYFDLVIGAPSVNASDAAKLLAFVTPLMTPDGTILLFEEAAADPVASLVLGRAPRAWSPELTQAGFADTAVRQNLVLARRANPGVPVAVDESKAEPREFTLLVEPPEAEAPFTQQLLGALREFRHTVHLHVASEGVPALHGEIVYLASANPPGESLLDTQVQRCAAATKIIQALEAQNLAGPLTFVTRGAFSTAFGDGPLDPAQATLWGIGRVASNEHARLHPRLIDLHSQHPGSARWLAGELSRRDEETEVQLAAGYRYVNRQRHQSLIGEIPRTSDAIAAFALDFQPQGGLDSLHLRPLDRRTPEANEVEIAVRAAGLNFRDVLWTMGMLPEEAVEHGFSGPTIGMECAGEVVRVGAGVTNVKPGDRVVAFASSCFASHVTTHSGSVALIPEALTFAEAATIPTVFLTAYYALDHLARLEPGETVLIHGAAGGVGLAALQIAKLQGAKVIGTAGSARKRRMLELLGADHVLNSRSLEFADEVMRLTGGTGVDVVLNSLAGEAITKSLQCLRPFGRFLEIGKRDLYANSRIGLRPFRNNLSYFGIDADTLLIERAPLARRLFQGVIDLFARGLLRPIAFQTIPVSRAAEAFRAMQQSRHVGKLVVTIDRENVRIQPASGQKIEPGVTYLVTGGLGGFGLATAEWLAAQGATSLALVSRRGATTEEARQGIARIEKLGTMVRPFACDIADRAAVDSAIATIRAEMPPLTGVFHAAAVIEDAPLVNLSEAQIERVFRPKLLGAWNLHEATLADPLRMFVNYSSSSASIGNPGQGAYVAANLYLESLTLYRRSLGLPALSVGWGAIKDAGFLTRHENVAAMLKTRTGLDATPCEVAMADLARLCAADATRVSAGRFDLHRLAQLLPSGRAPRFRPVIPKDAASTLLAEQTLADLLKNTPAANQPEVVRTRIREHAGRVLGTSGAQIDLDRPLAELGLDSLMAVELANGVERDLGRPISVMQILSAGSLAAVADHVLSLLAQTSGAQVAS